jgi:hypothetical protein
MDDAVVPGRKILRQRGNVQMWQENIDGPHRDTGPLLRYFVGSPDGRAKSFDAPGDAWEHFRRLTGTLASIPPAPKRHHGEG